MFLKKKFGKSKLIEFHILTILLCINLPGELFAADTGRITGTVIEKESGSPLSDANILIIARWEEGKKVKYENPRGASTDQNGRFLIRELAPGEYVIKVSYMGYRDAIRNKIPVEAGETTKLDFTLISRAIKGQRLDVVADRYARTADYSYIAAKLPLEIHLTPLSIDVITQQVLQEEQAITLGDALKSSISINVQKSLGTEDYFLIRGFDSNSAGLVLNNGIRIPSASPFKFYGFGFHNLYNIEQVEVLKGPAAFLYGGNTLSGAVNLVRKRPEFDNFGRIKLMHSRYDSYLESVDMNYCSEDSNHAFRINSFYQISNQYRKHVQNKTFAINPSIAWRPDNLSLLTITIEYENEHLKPDVGIPLYNPDGEWRFPDVNRKASFQKDFDKAVDNNYSMRIDYQRDLTGTCQLRNKFFLNYLSNRSRFTLPLIPQRSRTRWKVPRNMYNLDQFQLVIGNQFEINREMNIFNFKHNIVGGLELVNIANNTRKRTTVVKMVYLFNQREITSGDFDDFITFPKISTNTSQWIGAVYLIDYIYLLDKLQLFCGGRLDYIDYYTDRRNAAFDYIGRSLSSEPVPFSRNFLKFSPMAGIVYKETANLIFYANAGQAFASGQRIVDQPETSKQYEFGYKYRSSNDLIRTIASFYRIKKENMSIPLTGPLQGNIHTSTGSQLVNGVEFEFIANPGFNWFLTLKSSFTYAEYIKYRALTATDEGKLTLKDFSGNVPLFVPAQISDIQVHKEFLNSLDFGLGLRYVSDQYANYENDYEIKDYMVYQFSFSYEINKFLFRLSVDKISRKNLLSRGLGPYSVIPIEPLEIRGSAGAYF